MASDRYAEDLLRVTSVETLIRQYLSERDLAIHRGQSTAKVLKFELTLNLE